MSESQSIDALEGELIEFCLSDSLSEDGLREILERFNNNLHNNIDNYNFFFLACRNELVTEGILRCLLEYFPNAAGTTHSSGVTPLHTILFGNKNVTRDMVQLLIDAHPESIDKESSTGLITPLHALSRNKSLDDTTAVDILGLLLERCPEAVRRADSDIHGVLPIHLAVMTSKSPEFCRMLIEAYPGSERIATSSGMVPFDLSFAEGAVVTAKYLLGLYPESINVANRDGAYPIHRAIVGVTREAPTNALEMVQMLLDCDLNVASQKLDGSFPLCVVYFFSMSFGEDATSKVDTALKIAQVLYDAYPEAIIEEDLSLLINRFPEDLQAFINTQLTYARQARDSTLMNTHDVNGQLPLHKALRDNATLGSIKLLVKGNPTALQTPDNDGALPLFLAIQHYDSTKVVDFLVGLDPNTLTAVDRGGNTALHHACHGAKHETIALLLEKYGAVSVSQSNALNKLPIHLLLESNATANREDDNKYMESIFRLLRAYPDTLMMSEDIEQQQSISESSTSHVGKTRKICTD